jgi:hypothetical protein
MKQNMLEGSRACQLNFINIFRLVGGDLMQLFTYFFHGCLDLSRLNYSMFNFASWSAGGWLCPPILVDVFNHGLERIFATWKVAIRSYLWMAAKTEHTLCFSYPSVWSGVQWWKACRVRRWKCTFEIIVFIVTCLRLCCKWSVHL